MEKIKNIEKASERIKLAIKNGERIILYGDSDLDGIASVVIIKEAIEAVGGNIHTVCFPNRELDGYGINLNALEFLKHNVPALFIALDLGIANAHEIDQANAMGFRVLVVDHHEPLPNIPAAEIIVAPKMKDDPYSFKEMCNGGLSFYLAMELLGDTMTLELKNSLLELAALATISDMMPQVGQNKDILDGGLKSLEKTSRMGFKAFFELFSGHKFSIQKMISSLNAAESENFTNKSYQLLVSDSFEEAETIARELADKMLYKQQQVKSITEEVERRILSKVAESVIFEGDMAWKLILAGSVASVIASKHQKPTFIFKKMDTESAGSVRSLKEGQSAVEAMKGAEDLLISYGGHPKAAGFRVKNENVEKFKQYLINYFNNIR